MVSTELPQPEGCWRQAMGSKSVVSQLELDAMITKAEKTVQKQTKKKKVDLHAYIQLFVKAVMDLVEDDMSIHPVDGVKSISVVISKRKRAKLEFVKKQVGKAIK